MNRELKAPNSVSVKTSRGWENSDRAESELGAPFMADWMTEAFLTLV